MGNAEYMGAYTLLYHVLLVKFKLIA